jgi:hypothetical protein
MSDSSVRMQPRSSVLEELSKVAAARGPEGASDAGEFDAPERSDPLPRPGDAYMAHARRAAKPQMTLFFVSRDYLPDGFSYANLERVRLVASEKPGSGPVLLVRFSGSVVTEAVIEGRNLYPLCNAIGLHLMPWVWVHPSPKDFAGEDAAVIRSITFREVKV